MDDPREDCLYSMGQVLSLALLMFACRISSLRKLDLVSDDALFRDNWCVFSRAQTDTVICSRQMTNVLAATDPEQIAALRPRLVKGLIRQKQLPDAFLLGHLMVVSDGTGIRASSKFHCSQCLTQKHQDGSMTYMHNVLETKVITWNGLALSIMTEPQLNPEDGKYDKQDCESKAFKRMLPRLKEEFPREWLAHLLDSGYCNGPLFKAIEAVNQKFICCFKEGSIPTLYAEALTLRDLNPLNRITQTLTLEGHRVTRVYTWANGLEYQGLTLDFVMCQETVEDKTTTFAYLTNFTVDRENVITIADGGRKRWTIENEGFNVQKTGYELEHFCDCSSFEVMFALYLLLQLAHAFMQLLARSNLIDPVTDLTFLALLLLEALRNHTLPEELFAPDLPRFQIRFAKAPT
ncbi:MAG: hypothetical protein NTX53_16475 [candidate division WOR-3 bacterium]|nr:hypothetical protein [candidate division WOR-3 bacterium]